jgi:hypothetical protein
VWHEVRPIVGHRKTKEPNRDQPHNQLALTMHRKSLMPLKDLQATQYYPGLTSSTNKPIKNLLACLEDLQVTHNIIQVLQVVLTSLSRTCKCKTINL